MTRRARAQQKWGASLDTGSRAQSSHFADKLISDFYTLNLDSIFLLFEATGFGYFVMTCLCRSALDLSLLSCTDLMAGCLGELLAHWAGHLLGLISSCNKAQRIVRMEE